MELDELKNTWKEEDKRLESRIKVNENLLIRMNMENATGEFDKIFNISLVGRNLALVYCLISVGAAILMLEEIEYSLPAILGGLAMLWSFVSHLSIEKPDYTAPLVQVQKAICNFRIHMAANAKYDISIVTLWLLTLAPVYLRYVYNVSLYSDGKALSVFCLVSAVVLTLLTATSRKTYKRYDQKLKNTEAYLAELIELEKK